MNDTTGQHALNLSADKGRGVLYEQALHRLHDAGLPFDEILADGRFHRAKPPDDACWYVANEGTTTTGKPWLALSGGDFRETGGEHVATISLKPQANQGFTGKEISEILTTTGKAKKVAAEVVSRQQEKARFKAMELWANATGTKLHPYLAAKRIERHNTRVWASSLLIPYYSVAGSMRTLERILPNGKKKAMPGGKWSGSYHPINWFGGTGEVYICEGFSTAAAVAEVKGVPTVCAGYAGNLLPVAKAIKAQAVAEKKVRDERLARYGSHNTVLSERWPHRHYDAEAHVPDFIVPKIIIAADNDWNTPGNPGMTQADKAAAAVGGTFIYPPFGPGDIGPTGRPLTDWWDYYARSGEI